MACQVRIPIFRHARTGFVAALKIIKKTEVICGSEAENEKALQQLIREIKIQTFLDHPNLIKLYDFFSDEHNVYLLLEVACDGPLIDYLGEDHCFSEESTSIVIR